MILAMAGPVEERAFRLGWSLWRRADQAIARRCHEASRAAWEASEKKKKKVEPSSIPVSITTTTLNRGSARLAEASTGERTPRWAVA